MTQITKELYDRVLNAQTAEDLAAIALDMGVELSEEEVQSLYDRLHGDTVDSIPDDELSTIAGGNAVGDGWIFAEVHVGGPCLPGYNKMWGGASAVCSCRAKRTLARAIAGTLSNANLTALANSGTECAACAFLTARTAHSRSRRVMRKTSR